MTIEFLLNLIQWLLPTGAGGAIVIWIFNKNIRQARTAKEVHDTYKAMYEDLQGTLLELQNDNSQLHKAILRLETVIRHATQCRYYATCPLRSELQRQQKDGRNLTEYSRGEARVRGQPLQRRFYPPDKHGDASVYPCRQSVDGTPSEPPP